MLIIFFILGLIIGSFINVVIVRLDVAESILGRSHCPHCKARIRWYDNIPLFSFTMLKTRCRDCGEKISWQYPLVEIATGVIFALVGGYFFDIANPQSWLETFHYLFIFSLLLVVFVYDLKFMEIPMIMIWIGTLWSVLYFLLADWMFFNPALGILSSRLFSGILAGIIAFLFFFILSSVSKEKWMGMGDAYLAFLAGLIVGWPTILIVLMLAFATGAVVGMALIYLKKKTMKSQVPFAPFIVLGVFLTVIIPVIFPAIKYWFLYF
jgi:leader peptidase (prepilin peptidase) / N-methyltransferase